MTTMDECKLGETNMSIFKQKLQTLGPPFVHMCTSQPLIALLNVHTREN